MKSFVGAIAMVRHPVDEEKRWLLKWSPQFNHYRMIMAEKLEGESYRESLDREIAWDLNLRKNKDYLMSSMSRLHVEEVMQMPNECSESLYILEFFVTDLYGKVSKQQIEEQDDTRWLTNSEILAGQTDDGKLVDPHLVALLKKFELISAHH